jgi:hypothetical protein
MFDLQKIQLTTEFVTAAYQEWCVFQNVGTVST